MAARAVAKLFVAGAEEKHATHLKQKVAATAASDRGEPYLDEEPNASHNTPNMPLRRLWKEWISDFCKRRIANMNSVGLGKVINSSQDPNICFRNKNIEAPPMSAEIRITLHGK